LYVSALAVQKRQKRQASVFDLIEKEILN
jgi:hypothetical protein